MPNDGEPLQRGEARVIAPPREVMREVVERPPVRSRWLFWEIVEEAGRVPASSHRSLCHGRGDGFYGPRSFGPHPVGHRPSFDPNDLDAKGPASAEAGHLTSRWSRHP